MFVLIKNIDVYAPKSIGINDILICGNKIIEVGKNLDYSFKNIKKIDGSGKKAVPSFIDQHIHVLGGGGEGGYRTRVPEVNLSELLRGGVTTLVGLLGTDCITRNVESLVAKTKALKEYGLTAYCLTGGYEYPSPTITGCVKKDIVMIEEIIGIKLAISDHRSSSVTMNELEKMALSARVGGMLSGKAGYLKLHMGNADAGLDLVFDILKKGEIPTQIFRPTHVGRKEKLFYQSIEFNKMEGYIDITASDDGNILTVVELFKILNKENALLDKVTLSSDGNGSWSTYDSFGNMTDIGAASSDGIYKQIKKLVRNNIYSLEDALPFGTSNVAHALGISGVKGYIKENYSPDILILDGKLEIDTVIANGNVLMENKEILTKVFFE